MIVDKHLENFAVSDDLVRIKIDDSLLRFYTAAFLQSQTGHGLLRRDKSGSVIDHLSVEHVAAQRIPLLAREDIESVSELMRQSFELIESARLTLVAAVDEFERSLPAPTREAPPKAGWTVPFEVLSDRIDAAAYDPLVAAVRQALLDAGGVHVSEVAEVLKPPGRHKTRYVGPDFGLPFLSGTQILQLEVINQRYMAPQTFKDVEGYKLRHGWSVYQADGRAEEALGIPAFVPSDRDGWLASGHVGRLVPRDGIEPGWLWVAARTWQAQIQLKSLASGSVVDSTFPWDMEQVVLPPPAGVDGMAVQSAWDQFAEARRMTREATLAVDAALEEISGVGDEELPTEAGPTQQARSGLG